MNKCKCRLYERDALRSEIARLKEENHALDQINRDIQTAAAHLDEVLAELARRDAALNELLLLIEEHGAEHIRSHAKQILKIRMYAKDEETFIRKSVADKLTRLNEIMARLK